mmetsp:Transcript_42743/g.91245  ORF Transcript_42743/g.91245 Transcript_42743/m.91245 type:complete len:269 (-) Transcript_42743:406-1212(-)
MRACAMSRLLAGLCNVLPVSLATSPIDPPALHFVHVPKTAGTRAKAMFKRLGIRTLRTLNGGWHPKADGQATCSHYHLPAQHKTYRSEDDKALYRLAIARQPYDRLISEYRFECWANRPRLARILGISVDQIGGTHDRPFPCQKNRTQLNLFLRVGLPREYRFNSARQSETDCHLLCQHEYMQGVQHMLCGEGMPEVLIDHISAHFGNALNQTRLADARAVWSKRKSRTSRIHGYDARQLLDRSTIELIHRLCPADFGICNYSVSSLL